MANARLIIGFVVFVASMIYLFAFAIPNVQRAQEEVRIAQEEYDQAQLELDQAMDDLNTSIEELNARNDIN